jgi:UDP-N-acetylmuramate--alanine ligase
MFYKEFAEALSPADIIVIDKIYAASELPISGINSKLIVEEIKKLGHKNVSFISEHNEILNFLIPELKKNDLVLTLGAGDITRLGPTLLTELKKKKGDKNFDFAA